MRPSLVRLATRPIPRSAIPPTALRLPPTPQPRPNLDAVSPTLDRLVANAAAAATAVAVAPGKTPLPLNLRINAYVPRRKEYHGVQRSHRDLGILVVWYLLALA